MKRHFAIAILAVTFCLTGLGISGTALAQQCVDNGDGTVTDNLAGLMWQTVKTVPMNWHDAMSYASSLSLGGHSDWWLPSRNELQGVYRSPCKSMMNVEPSDYSAYWSSTISDDGTDRAWVVNLGYGNDGPDPKSNRWYVRAVRAVRAGQLGKTGFT